MATPDDFLDELPIGRQSKATSAPTPAPVPADEPKLVRRKKKKVRTTPPVVEAAPKAPRKLSQQELLATLSDPSSDEPYDNAEETMPITPDPTTVADQAGDEILQTLPEPSVPAKSRRVLPPTPPSGDTLPVATSSSPPANVNQRWDEFLLSLNQATLIAVYELGVQSLTEFSDYAKSDLVRPRGRLTEPQADEIESKLRIMGITLAQVSRAGSLRTGGGGQRRIRHLRGPIKNQPALPADATAAQRRQHRLNNNRLTM